MTLIRSPSCREYQPHHPVPSSPGCHCTLPRIRPLPLFSEGLVMSFFPAFKKPRQEGAVLYKIVYFFVVCYLTSMYPGKKFFSLVRFLPARISTTVSVGISISLILSSSPSFESPARDTSLLFSHDWKTSYNIPVMCFFSCHLYITSRIVLYT
jgi:hypothetical protein